ncbi:hypothetical protein [Paraburkholderia sp. HD33-4]|uniref:hypothetical protein n=1 Tax=Paraburkholderia sp. HD33-4 TaxID=2883242 RepID=UPI001F158968|nr:hypothetical protein [Paraburkholderia sp. HD33-4]
MKRRDGATLRVGAYSQAAEPRCGGARGDWRGATKRDEKDETLAYAILSLFRRSMRDR